MTTRRKLTPHQSETLERLRRATRSIRYEVDGETICVRYRWISSRQFGCAGALARLVEKGYAEHRTTRGPRGGWYDEYRPTLTEREEGMRAQLEGPTPIEVAR